MEIVERQVFLPTDREEAWGLLTRPEDLAGWLGDSVTLDPTPGSRGEVIERDGTRRRLVVEEVDTGRRLSWRWWTDGDGPDAQSRVEIDLVPTDDGTLVRVVERAVPGPARPTGGQAMARSGEAWSHRLLHLEALLLLAAAIRG
jgi:uncharacterized protein YndB with AHSA1/START domain